MCNAKGHVGTSISEGDPPFGKAIDLRSQVLMSNHFGDLVSSAGTGQKPVDQSNGACTWSCWAKMRQPSRCKVHCAARTQSVKRSQVIALTDKRRGLRNNGRNLSDARRDTLRRDVQAEAPRQRHRVRFGAYSAVAV